MTSRLLSLLGSLLCTAGTCSALPPQYNVIDLGTLGGSTARAWDINESATVVGTARLSGGEDRGFMWNGSMLAAQNDRGYLTAALAVNDPGDVAGMAVVDGAPGLHLFRDGDWVPMGTIGGEVGGTVRALNNAGHATGVARNAQGRNRAFYFDGAGCTDLGTLGGQRSEGYGMNNRGDVVGFADTADGVARASLWADGEIVNVGAEFSFSSVVYDVNESRVVVGEAFIGTGGVGFRAIVWQNGDAVVLGTLGGNYSVLLDITEGGTAVGVSQNPGGQNLAAIYHESYGLLDLNSRVLSSAGLTLREAWAVNELGYVTGFAVNASGQSRAFLAVPVPAPGAAGLLAPLGVLAWRRRR